MYLKTSGIKPIQAATGSATCSIGEVVFPLLAFLSHYCLEALSFIA